MKNPLTIDELRKEYALCKSIVYRIKLLETGGVTWPCIIDFVDTDEYTGLIAVWNAYPFDKDFICTEDNYGSFWVVYHYADDD